MSADTAIPGLEATVMCRNMMGGPTVIASDPKQTYEVIFAGRDDPGGDDIQPIPAELKRAPAFARALRQGILQVVAGEDDPVIQAALAKQTDAFARRMSADELKARESLDHKAENDLLVIACIGPGPREGTSCEEQIPVRASDQASRPPLCSRHEHLTDRCVKRGSNPWQLED